MVWIMVVALVLGAIGIGWSVVRFQDAKPIKESSAITTCDDLRDYILGEEELSLPLWKKYHKQVIAYSRGLPKAERPAKVREIAASVTLVLKSDLRIYREMKKLPQCLTSEFRAQVEEWTTTTKDMILYLAGRKKIEGEKFDPKDGVWDTTFYDAFYSATDNLEEGLTQV
jgi:hypothetical protein